MIGAMRWVKSSKGNVRAETSREQAPVVSPPPSVVSLEVFLSRGNKVGAQAFAPCSPGDKGLTSNHVPVTPHQTLRGNRACTHREALQGRESRLGITEAEALIHGVLILTPGESRRSSDMLHL